MAADQCPACAQPALPTDRYCEKCGHELAASATPFLAPGWVSSSGVPAVCSACQGNDFGAEGYCEGCGQRRPASQDHSEMRLGQLAAVTDKGKRHHHNEDAVAVGQAGRAVVAVVCDGVSSSHNADTASHAAADAAVAALVDELGRARPAADAIGAATRAAQAAAALAGGRDPGANPPSSTFVCAVVTADAVTVGWVGDSRAYWLPDAAVDTSNAVTDPSSDYARPARLTVDDSMAGQLAAAGKPVPGDIAGSIAAALLRWLGADAPDTSPHLHTFTPPGPGRVLVCSDGLFRYRPEPAELAEATPPGDPLDVASSLVQLALDAGGQDNIAVALLPYPPEMPPHPRESP